jgi:hypothetical protein
LRYAIDKPNAGAETVENSPGIDAARHASMIRIRDIMEYFRWSMFDTAKRASCRKYLVPCDILHA